jgi:hypothetical protein
MPISFKCSGCDKLFRVGDEMAGKKSRCPACSTVLTVPGGETNVAPKPSAKARVAAPPPLPKDDDYEVVNEDDAPTTKSKAKTKPKAAPARDDDDDDDDRPRRKRRQDDDEDDEGVAATGGDVDDDDYGDEDEDDDKPKKKKKPKKGKKNDKKSPVGLILLISGGVLALLLLAGGGVLLWFLLGGGGIGEALTYAPDNVESITSTRADAIENSPFGKAVKAQNPNPSVPRTGIASVTQSKGIIQTVVMSSSDATVTFTKLKASVTVEELKGAARAGANFTETKVGNYTIYEAGFECFCLVNSTTLLGGSKAVLQKVLARNAKPTLTPEFQKVMNEVNWGRGVAMAKVVKPNPFGGGLGMGAEAGMESEVTMIDIGVNATFQRLAFFKDATAAENFKKKQEEDLQRAKSSGLVPAEFKEVLDSAKISQFGTKVSMEMTIKQEAVTKAGKGGAFGVPGLF